MDLIPKYQDQINLLRGKHQNQNIIDHLKISEYQRFLVNLMLGYQYVDHGIILNPSKPSAKLRQQKVNLLK